MSKALKAPGESDLIEVHKGCGGTVHNLGEDAISYCEACEHICEGDTEFIPIEKWELSQ